jgi:hypothetical protein
MICRDSGPVSRLCDREAARVCAALTPTRPGYALGIRGMFTPCISLRANKGQTVTSIHGRDQQPSEQPPAKSASSSSRGRFRSKLFVLSVPGGGQAPPRGCPRRILSPIFGVEHCPAPSRTKWNNNIRMNHLEALSTTHPTTQKEPNHSTKWHQKRHQIWSQSLRMYDPT